jgi:hypothetical protein
MRIQCPVLAQSGDGTFWKHTVILMNNADKFRILSPLVLFLLHVVYLTVWSPDPLLIKWIDGSFTFFLALVLCNIIRARIATSVEPDDPPDDASHVPEGPKSDRAP